MRFGLSLAFALALLASLPAASALALRAPRTSLLTRHHHAPRASTRLAVESWYDSGVRLTPEQPCSAPAPSPEAAEAPVVPPPPTGRDVSPPEGGGGFRLAVLGVGALAGAAAIFAAVGGDLQVGTAALTSAVGSVAKGKPPPSVKVAAEPPPPEPEPELTREEKIARARAAAREARAEYERSVAEFRARTS
ncbi:hypothetical protein AB1Y20_008757 [Prymnesium parvum]|uniref:Uncharacterized protein n=1 Tax=Prymnesium parvum TaxID=97485 RepID=A0AB34IU49_PRYPA